MSNPITKRRVLAAVGAALLVALLVAAAAVAAPARDRHPIRGKVTIHLTLKHHKQRHKPPIRRRVFAPKSIRAAAEVSAVVLDRVTQKFAQVTFDRGRVTAVASGTITLQQRQGGAIWRTQSFTVPADAVVTFNGRPVALTQIPTGAAARVESSGAVGGTLTVVRVNAYERGEAPLPPTQG